MFNKDDFCNINYIEFDDDFNIELNLKLFLDITV